MNDGKDRIQKALYYAEQAVAEDKAHNYEDAEKHYLTAVDWLMQAMQAEGINIKIKQVIETKIEEYRNRAQDVRKKLENGPIPMNDVANANTEIQNPKASTNEITIDSDPNKKRIVEMLEAAIVSTQNITFDDIIGLVQAKEAFKEAVILPIRFPQLFQGKRKYSTSGIMLYGLPGTGKSFLAQAIATESKSTLIGVTSSDFCSPWIGDGEKRVKALFELARQKQPSIILLDGVENMFGRYNDTESESPRRVKTEFLVQIHDMTMNNSTVILLVETNTPWELDPALRRKLVKRIYVPLPDVTERVALFKTHLRTSVAHTLKEEDWMELAHKSENYSCADIVTVCREAWLNAIRKLASANNVKMISNKKSNDPHEVSHDCCASADPNAVGLTLDNMNSDRLHEPSVTMEDMLTTLAAHKSAIVEADLIRMKQFTNDFGEC